MSKVAIVRCTSYEASEVKAAVQRGIELIGGAGNFFKAGEKILLKPNLLAGDPPEKCVTTHPAVFKAVAEVFKNAHAKLSYGDSPGFGSPEATARKAGIAAVAGELEIAMADFHQGQEVVFPDGVQNKKFVIARGVLDSDGIISLPKLKTHGLTRMTGCIKNQFGCIPGLLKGEYHVKLPDVQNFAQMLVDLNMLIKPRLFIMDGIMAMEGNGPRGGNPRQMNLLMFSSDPVAIDATICRLVGLKPEFVPTIELGFKSGLGSYAEQDIEMLGDDLSCFMAEDFKVERKTAAARHLPLSGLLNNLIVAKPYIVEEGCVKCGVCINVCPVTPKVLDWPNGDKTRPPVYDYNRCIKCYCCQELCPESTIIVKAPALRRWVDRLSGS